MLVRCCHISLLSSYGTEYTAILPRDMCDISQKQPLPHASPNIPAYTVYMDQLSLTKYSHACLVATKNGTSIVIDPGAWSYDFVAPAAPLAVIITHEHPDHLDIEKLREIARVNPDVMVLGPEAVITQLEDFSAVTVNEGETVQVGDFALRFIGDSHAMIDDSLPLIANTGVMVDEYLYYPGDSFTLPDVAVHTLALPVSAPWMKFSEAATFLRTVRPQFAFPTHDAILSDQGKELADRMFSQVAKEIETQYERL